MRKKIVSIIVLVLSIGLAAKSQSHNADQQNGPKVVEINSASEHHVVMQLTSNDSLVWHGALNNIQHLKDKWGEHIKIELVAHGPGIEMLITAKTTEQKRIAMLKKIGVEFFGCENTMKGRNISKDQIIPEAGFVPSGVVEIVMKQEQGWSYLKAGF